MRPSSSKNSVSGRADKSRDLGEIDGLFHNAGLVRSLRGSAGARIRAGQRLDRAGAEELSRPAPPTRIAANGVEWLAVPGWEKLPVALAWIQHATGRREPGLLRLTMRRAS